MEQQRLRPLDYHFARFIADGCGESIDGVLAHSAALLSYRAGQGDVCIELEHVDAGERFGPLAELSVGAWQQQLQQYAWVGAPGERCPLVLCNRRLYLYKYHAFEQRVADHLKARLQQPPAVDRGRLRTGLDQLFGTTARDDIDWQRVAAAIAVLQRFAVISGGPGTGKTTTVVKVLSLLLEQQADMRIALAAPTGKAAARLAESIRSGLDRLGSTLAPEIAARVPTRAVTIHRLLRPMQGRFRHNRRNPLLVDCLVLDEASMIDLSMMARVLDALPPDTRVILLGDRDQLSSVEAGSVLNDICGRGADDSFSSAFAQTLSEVGAAPVGELPVTDSPPISDAVALLKRGYRFAADSGIGLLAAQVQQQSSDAIQTLRAGSHPDLQWLPAQGPIPETAVIDWAVRQYAGYFAAADVEQALAQFEQARLLCALRQGPAGVTVLNQRITQALRRRGVIRETGEHDHYRGRPILITRNDYASGLFNGDIGLIWPDADGTPKAWFADPDSSDQDLRAVSLHRLPPHETAYCLSVHKSQGSEFDRILLVLPGDSSPVVSRELLYTGITRARKTLAIYGSAEVFTQGCRTATRRSSGLAGRLGWPSRIP